jgi:hypothetical protein
MSAMAAAVVGSAVIGGISSASASKSAAAAQVKSAELGAAEQRAARENLERLLEPYRAAGTPALAQQMAALGLAGPEAQQAYVAGQEQSPLFQAIARQGEEALLQKASATGGLRGGNVQGALAQFRPSLLNQFLEQQYGRLGEMTSLGQRSAAGVGAAGVTSAGNIAELLGQSGQAQAGGILGSANAFNTALGQVSGFATSPAGQRAFGGFGGAGNVGLSSAFKSAQTTPVYNFQPNVAPVPIPGF